MLNKTALFRSILACASLLLLTIFSCGEKEPETAADFLKIFQAENPNYLPEEFQNKIKSVGFLIKISGQDPEQIRSDAAAIYEARKGQPLWQFLESDSVRQELPQLIEQLYAADKHGLKASYYNTSTVDTLYRQIYQQKKWKGQEALGYKMELDLLATSAAISMMHDLSAGRYESKWDMQNAQFNVADLVLAGHEDVSKMLLSAAPPLKAYERMLEKIETYEAVAAEGGFPKVTAVSKGKSGAAVKALTKRLALAGDLETEREKFDEKVEEAVIQFQQRHGFPGSGKIDKKTLTALNRPVEDLLNQMYLSLERYRWLPDSLGARYIWVNIPEYQIQIREGDDTKMKMKAVVGEKITPTPVFAEDMTHIVFSPAWNIPWSIVRDEVFAYAGYGDFPSVLIIANVEVIKGGKKLDPYKVDWKSIIGNKKEMLKYRFRQKPGTKNSLGAVKFIFQNKYAVYLHDTPAKKYFKEEYRALSAGCIRVEQPVDFSEYLLQDKEGWDADRIKRNMGGSSERRVNLNKKVPVYLVYFTSWVDDSGKLQFRDDIYKHDKKQKDLAKDMQSGRAIAAN